MMRQPVLAIAGALLLVAAAVAELAWVAPLRAEQAALRMAAPPMPRGAPEAPRAMAAQLAQFHAAFPPLDRLADVLAGMDAAAREAGVPLRSAEYRLEQRAGAEAGRLARYRIALRTAGDYARIRAFLGQLLERQASVALDDVQFRRTADASLEADIRLSLYLRRR
jgi:hypothetical protein